MARQIVVNAGISETRVAVLDGGVLTELFVERRRHRSIVGNVYKGVVTNVLPGMQAAFVDIGLAKDAFLYAGDFIANLGEYERMMLAEDEGDDLELTNDDPAPSEETGERPEAPPERERRVITPIEDVLHKGQEILVQVSKESLGTKGARITSFISLPGRYLVYMPQVNHLGVSRRIHDADERDRLRQLVRGLRPPAAAGSSSAPSGEGRGEEEFRADIEFLVRLWQQVQARFAQAPPRSALHEEGDLVFRVVRDLFAADVEEIVIDAEEEYRRAMEYAEALVPALAHRIQLYAEREPVFEARGIEKEIEKAAPAPGVAEVGRLPGDRPDRGAGVDRREHGQVRRQARPRGDDPQDQPGGGAARSCGRSACATWAASSSSTSSTWTARSTGARCSAR